MVFAQFLNLLENNFLVTVEKLNQYSPFRISNMTSGGGKSNHRKLSLNT
jgi:hypothetical protein